MKYIVPKKKKYFQILLTFSIMEHIIKNINGSILEQREVIILATQKLKKLRKEREIPVSEIIKILGLKTKSAYYKKETGALDFSLEEAKLLSELFDLSIESIFFDHECSKMEHTA
jgi:DNA-binding XRE family transcriptional regulator